MGIAGAILLGLIAGFVGFIPLFVALRLSQRHTSVGTASLALFGLGGVAVSLIVVVVELLLCSQLAHEALLPFGLSELVALIVSTAVYVVYKNVLAKGRSHD